MAEHTHARRLRNLVVDGGLQWRYVLWVTGMTVVVAVALGLLIVQQSTFASEQIITALQDEATSWLDAQARAAVIAQLGQTDLRLVATMTAVGFGLTAVVAVALLWMSHRMAGPLYRIGYELEQLRQGRLSAPGDLRRGDQFRHLFDAWRATHDALCERARADIAVMTEAIDATQRVGTHSPSLHAALEELRQLVEDKRASL
ncbi:MAG: hypothetical protein AAB426_12285 [Myxococcota bacterium]